MAWNVVDRNKPGAEQNAPVLSDAIREKIRGFFPRYETKRAALLPALHVVQDELGHLSWPAMVEIAELLEIKASDVFDVVSFYTHFWSEPKGGKVVMVCRSITCEILGANQVLAECKRVLGIGEHETTADGKYSLVTEECLAACDHGPCMFVNERIHKRVQPEQVKSILADDKNDRLEVPRSNLYDGVTQGAVTK